MTQVDAVLFDYSGTLFRLEEDESWFDGMKSDTVEDRRVDGHVQAELMRRLTAPTGQHVLHRQGVRTAVVSNIAFDVRPAFASIGAAEFVDEFVLSFEMGAVKPDAAIFRTALTRLGVPGEWALMVGDSDEADGGARALGCGFVLVDPLPTEERTDGLRVALRESGIAV